MATQGETALLVRALTLQVGKIGDETRTLLTQIAALIDTINNGVGSSSQELVDAVAALQAQITIVDDLVADIPPPGTGPDPVPDPDPNAPNSTTGGQG